MEYRDIDVDNPEVAHVCSVLYIVQLDLTILLFDFVASYLSLLYFLLRLDTLNVGGINWSV